MEVGSSFHQRGTEVLESNFQPHYEGTPRRCSFSDLSWRRENKLGVEVGRCCSSGCSESQHQNLALSQWREILRGVMWVLFG